jgi:hypothetical protein
MNIFDGVRVGFEFVISPAVAIVAEIIDPLGGIRRGVGGTVEFIRPGELPTPGAGGWGLGTGGYSSDEDDYGDAMHSFAA